MDAALQGQQSRFRSISPFFLEISTVAKADHIENVDTKLLDATKAEQVFDELKRTAAESIAYVAYGKSYPREIRGRFGGDLADVQADIHRIASALMDSIRGL